MKMDNNAEESEDSVSDDLADNGDDSELRGEIRNKHAGVLTFAYLIL